MKTIKILLAVLAVTLLTSCSKEEERSTCNCIETRYTLKPGDQTYQPHSVVARPDLDCEDNKENISYDGSYHTKVTCN